MTYATRQDLVDRFGDDEISQRESMLPAGGVDRALADADAEINSYLAGRYVTPLNPVPVNVVRVAASLARYHLLGDSVSEQGSNAYKAAIAWLRDVQAGKAQVDGATVAANATPAATIVTTVGREKAFTGGIQ